MCEMTRGAGFGKDFEHAGDAVIGDLGTFSKFHRFTFYLHGLKIMIEESFPLKAVDTTGNYSK